MMKLRVCLDVDVDPAAWDEVYGNGASAAQVRTDIRTYVLTQLQESPGFTEAGATVTLA